MKKQLFIDIASKFIENIDKSIYTCKIKFKCDECPLLDIDNCMYYADAILTTEKKILLENE
jgi:hypothetical protein